MASQERQHNEPTRLQDGQNTNFAGVDELWESAKHLPRYNHDIVVKLSARLGTATDVMEFGAGIGTLAQIWLEKTGIKPTCLEIDPKLRQVIIERGFVCHEDLDEVQKEFDGIYTSNVLEHINDDVAALKRLHGALKPDSILAVYVPAFMCLFSEHDKAVGHYRRYSRHELHRKLQQAGFDVLESQYVDSLGFFAWLWVKLRGQKPMDKPTGGKFRAIYDKYIFPTSSLIDQLGARHFVGKNILAFARRKSG